MSEVAIDQVFRPREVVQLVQEAGVFGALGVAGEQLQAMSNEDFLTVVSGLEDAVVSLPVDINFFRWQLSDFSAAAGSSVLLVPFLRTVIAETVKDEAMAEWLQERVEALSFLTVVFLSVSAELLQAVSEGKPPDKDDILAFVVGAGLPFVARFLGRGIEFGIEK